MTKQSYLSVSPARGHQKHIRPEDIDKRGSDCSHNLKLAVESNLRDKLIASGNMLSLPKIYSPKSDWQVVMDRVNGTVPKAPEASVQINKLDYKEDTLELVPESTSQILENCAKHLRETRLLPDDVKALVLPDLGLSDSEEDLEMRSAAVALNQVYLTFLNKIPDKIQSEESVAEVMLTEVENLDRLETFLDDCRNGHAHASSAWKELTKLALSWARGKMECLRLIALNEWGGSTASKAQIDERVSVLARADMQAVKLRRSRWYKIK
ncbi:hypothetical protein CYMTET_25985, partial [Cymbomonas tetramitiformis]